MTQKNETALMPANDDHPPVAGATTVKVTILALFLLLVGGKFGLAVTLVHFAYAIILAAVMYLFWRGFRQHRSRYRR